VADFEHDMPVFQQRISS